MQIRSLVERKLPLAEDEVRLSKRARMVVFRGSYLYPREVTNVEKKPNYDRTNMHLFPSHIEITRTDSDGYKKFSGGDILSSRSYSDAVTIPVIKELSQPAALRRATRVEKVARRIKVATAGVLLLAGVGTVVGLKETESRPESVVSGVNLANNDQARIPTCVDALDNNGHIYPGPISGEAVAKAERVGEIVCSIGGYDFRATHLMPNSSEGSSSNEQS